METRERRMTQEQFEMYANLAVSLHRRWKEGRARMDRRVGTKGPVCQDLTDAYEHLRLLEECKELGLELESLAGEMAAAGMPLGVWVRVEREGEADAKVKVEALACRTGGRYKLMVD